MILKTKEILNLEDRVQRLGAEIDRLLRLGVKERERSEGALDWIRHTIGLDAETAVKEQEHLSRSRALFKVAVDQLHQAMCVELRKSPWFRNQESDHSIPRRQLDQAVIDKAWALLPEDVHPSSENFKRLAGI